MSVIKADNIRLDKYKNILAHLNKYGISLNVQIYIFAHIIIKIKSYIEKIP